MRHIDPDVLALLALGENAGTESDRGHLAACADCRSELENLAHAAAVGRSTLDAGELLQPDERVWRSIQAEVAEPAPVIPLRPRLARRLLAVAAAVVVLVGGVGVTLWALQPAPVTLLASATLDAFPAWVGSTGSAVVEQTAAGARFVDVTFQAPATEGGFREVWLISSDTSQLVSLGVVRGDTGRFTIPDGLDLTRYDLVDISEEPIDGNPEHSGDSILRGQLRSAA
ncbi:MAG TPA: anti-sigma factor [Rhodoglobus sp.]|nr:anti-sigma factor [Rhodoglobus sp.]HQJ33964.1 anti-sigma factor [Rhodoglobus sp.]